MRAVARTRPRCHHASVEERRRIALHNQIAAAWGEEAADTLFDLITPAGQDLAVFSQLGALVTIAALAFGLR